MGRINISFDNRIYNVDEPSLASTSAIIKSHLLNVMNGSGSTVDFNGEPYNVDSEKLSTTTSVFVNHINTVAGNGYKVVVNGAEYNVDSSKMSTAVQDLHIALGALNLGNSQQYRAGLYQTGAFDVYEQGGDIDSMMIASWDELIASEGILVNNNELSTKWDSDNTLHGDLFIIDDGSVTSIAPAAFALKDITGAVIPDCVTSIGMYAFLECYNLSNVKLSNNITIINESTFFNCRSLTEIDIPNGVTVIGNQAFTACSIVNIDIPSSVTIIENRAFSNTPIVNVKIPNGVTSIGDGAFINCQNLARVEIPSTVTHIGSQAFLKCPNLSNIIIDENNEYYYVSSSGCLVESASKTLILRTSTDELTIPSDGSVTIIGEYALEKDPAITDLIIPDTITRIEDGAFSDCENLTHVFIPDSVIFIGNGAFSGCTKLTNAEFEVCNGWQVEIQGAVASGNLSNPSTAATYLRHTYTGQSWSRTV